MDATLFAMPTARPRHPAKYTDGLLPVIARMLTGARLVLDPFGGTGKIALLRNWLPDARFVAGELEPEWARPGMVLANALRMPYAAATFDAVATSPAYGNRMADGLLLDKWQRNTYANGLGRELSPDNGAALQWGDAYRALHAAVWAECARVIKPRCRLVLNMKDHIRAGQRQWVTSWHVLALEAAGFRVVRQIDVPCPGMREGRNGDARVDTEAVILFERVTL